MTTWTPAGWTTLLGAGDPSKSYWEGRGGHDFFLETQVREKRSDFQKVLRGQWVAESLGEEPVDPQWGRSSDHYGKGDVWSALMLYKKKLIMTQGAAPARELGPSVVPTKVEELIRQWSKQFPKPPITTSKDGTITIPAASFSSAQNTVLMNSADDGQQMLHNGGDYVHPETSYVHYEVDADSEATYFLTANFTTWHINQDLKVTSNASTDLQDVPVFYTSGYWRETQPVMIDLVKGRNVLTFQRWTNRPLVLKEFFLFKSRPDIPIPDPARTPAPAPAPVPLDSIIELSQGKTCESQGILELSEEDCGLAAEYLGRKYTGARQEPFFPGCFCIAPPSQWAGNCNFNANRTGTGMDGDGTARAICQRA